LPNTFNSEIKKMSDTENLWTADVIIKKKNDCFNWLGYDWEQILILNSENLTQYIYKYESYSNWHFTFTQSFPTVIGNKNVAVIIHGMSMKHL